jgi:hypothetical protein
MLPLALFAINFGQWFLVGVQVLGGLTVTDASVAP